MATRTVKILMLESTYKDEPLREKIFSELKALPNFTFIECRPSSSHYVIYMSCEIKPTTPAEAHKELLRIMVKDTRPIIDKYEGLFPAVFEADLSELET